MKNVLIDNWSLEQIVMDLNDKEKLLFNKRFHDLLEAIVLWDKIYFPNNEYSGFWQYMQQDDISDYLSGLDEKNDFEDVSDYLYKKYYANDYTANVAKGAIRYSLLANDVGFDYLPCDKRATFINKSDIYNILHNEKVMYINGDLNSPFMRNDYLCPVNNEIKEFYNELNKYYNKEFFELKFPVLANYIIHNRPKNMSCFEYAASLKSKLPIKQFLNYMTKFEENMSAGNFIPCYRVTKDMTELVHEVCKMDMELIIGINGIAIPQPVLNYDIFKIRKLNYSFVKKLIKYTVSGNK